MPFHEQGDVRIHYQEAGDGYPLLCLPGGGINGSMANFTDGAPFDPMAEFKDEYRCVGLDPRNSTTGQSSGPLEVDRSWDSITDDQLALMDHLGIDKFLVLGFCIAGPMTWNLIKRAPDRVVAAVLSQPVGFRPEMPTLFYDRNMEAWGPALCEARDDVTMEQVEAYLANMYKTNPDFVFTVTRDFVRECQTPILVMPDDIPGHPFEPAMESAMLAPNSQVSLYPWKEPVERIPLAVRHVRSFLNSHTPAA